MILSAMKWYQTWLYHSQVDFSNVLKMKEIGIHINFRIYYIFVYHTICPNFFDYLFQFFRLILYIVFNIKFSLTLTRYSFMYFLCGESSLTRLFVASCQLWCSSVISSFVISITRYFSITNLYRKFDF